MIDVRVPDEQEGTKAVVRAWLKQVGDAVAVNDPLVELETDKVTQEVPAPAAGVLSEIVLDTDAEAVPGALLGRIDASERSRAKAGAQSKRASAAPSSSAGAPPSLRTNGVEETPPVSLGQARDPPAWHRPGAARPAPGAAGGSRARMSIARSPRRPRSASASPPPRSRATSRRRHPARPHAAQDRREHGARGQPRRRMSPRCSRPISRAIAAHKAALAERGREAQLHRLSSSRRRPRRWRSRRRSTAAGKTTASRSRRRSTSGSAPRSATRGWSCRWSRTRARSASRRSAPGSTT